MLFKFNKYLSPTWYFNISTEVSESNVYFVDYTSLSENQLKIIDLDYNYKSEKAVKCDAAFQILQKGIFPKKAVPICIEAEKKSRTILSPSFTGQQLIVDQDEYIDDLSDNYRFVRRFYGTLHAVQIFAIRILSLHNPIKELIAFLSTRKTKQTPLYKHNGFDEYKNNYEAFKSSLISNRPFVSVIIPTLNRYKYLKDVLIDLENQDYQKFEVIIVDQSDPFNESFYNGWKLDLHVIKQQEKALWKARNAAIKRAKGEYILLYDDDSRVDSDWIRQHLKCIDFFKCDISSGISLSKIGDKIPEDYSYFKWSAQIDTGNVMFPKKIMKETGMFDQQFEKQRMGDGEYGVRAYLYGKRNISNPYAKRIHLKVASGGLRQMGAWDAFQNKKILAPRPIPSILYYCRKYYGNSAARSLLAFTIPFTLLPYKYKGNNRLKAVSLLIFILISPIVLIQVMRSWSLASKKLKEGDKIEAYE